MSEKLTQREIKEKIVVDFLTKKQFFSEDRDKYIDSGLATIDSLERKYGKHHYKILDKDSRAYYLKDKRGLGKFSVDTSAIATNRPYAGYEAEGGHWLQYANQPQSVRDSLMSEGIRQRKKYGDGVWEWNEDIHDYDYIPGVYGVEHQSDVIPPKHKLLKEGDDSLFSGKGKGVLDYLIENPNKLMLGPKGVLMSYIYNKLQEEEGAPTVEWQAHEEKQPEFRKEFSDIFSYYSNKLLKQKN